MKRASGAAFLVLVVLFSGPVVATMPEGFTWSMYATGALVALTGITLAVARRSSLEQRLGFGVAAVTGAYWMWSARFGATSTLMIAWTVAVTVLVLWWVFTRDATLKPAKVKRGDRWWTEANLLSAFITAGLVKRPKDDGEPARLPGLGQPAHDDYGTTVRVRLPPGVLYSKVDASREALAAALGKPLHLVTVTQGRTDAANLATIRVAHPFEKTTRVVESPAVTSWRDPIVIGRDRRNRDLTIPAYDTGQLLVGGRTGSGKTLFLRLLAAHYALDPTTTLFVADGKGSVDDWGPLRDRCERLVLMGDSDAASRFMALVQNAQRIVTDRNNRGGRDWPGVLVILEEFSALLSSMDPKEKRDAERAVTRLVQTCRSANVMTVVAAQRPAASMMDTNTRAQAAVRVSLMMQSDRDATMVLGHTPTFDLPREVGEAIVVMQGHDDQFAYLDYFTDEAWVGLCASVARPPVEADLTDAGGDIGPAVGLWDDGPAFEVELRDAWLEPVRARWESDPEHVEYFQCPAPVERVADEPNIIPVPCQPEPSARDLVLAVFDGSGPVSTGRVVEATGKSRSTVAVALKDLVGSGDVVQVGRGVYALPGCVDAQSPVE